MDAKEEVSAAVEKGRATQRSLDEMTQCQWELRLQCSQLQTSLANAEAASQHDAETSDVLGARADQWREEAALASKEERAAHRSLEATAHWSRKFHSEFTQLKNHLAGSNGGKHDRFALEDELCNCLELMDELDCIGKQWQRRVSDNCQSIE